MIDKVHEFITKLENLQRLDAYTDCGGIVLLCPDKDGECISFEELQEAIKEMKENLYEFRTEVEIILPEESKGGVTPKFIINERDANNPTK